MINPQEALEAIDRLRENLMEQQEATVLFGSPKNDSFYGILSSIVQSFDDVSLYPSIQVDLVFATKSTSSEKKWGAKN